MQPIKATIKPKDTDPMITNLQDVLLLLDVSTLPKDKHAAFAHLYLDYNDSVNTFWEKLRCDPDYAEYAGDLQLTFQLRTLTQNHLPLLSELKKLGAHGGVQSLRELAALDESDWKKLIEKKVDGKPVGFPPDTPGKDDAEKIGNYARALAAAVEAAVHTASWGSDDAGQENHKRRLLGTLKLLGTLFLILPNYS